MDYKDFTGYANSFQAVARLGLESISHLLSHLGNPEKDLKFVHIAGTNGKGSISAFLQCILTESGLRCGKYISPNMLNVCERISVDGVDISESDMRSLMDRVRQAAELVQKELGTYPTQFEIWTAAAFIYFKSRECDIVVLETGLGGRKDATNIIPPPEVSVIAHIALDHTEYLGNTLSEIAFEKAGIIKAHEDGEGITVSAVQSEEAAKVLEKVCAERQNRLIITENCESVSHSIDGEVFNYKDMKNLCSHLLGIHQPANAAVAIEAALALGISREHIRRGVEKARNIGRFEIVSDLPLTLFDGAHNPDGMRTLADGLNRYFPDMTKTVILATMGDKDISGSLVELTKVKNISKIYTLTVQDNPRAMPAEKLAETVTEQIMTALPANGFAEIFDELSTDMAVICGSLYLYKDYHDYKNSNV